MLNKLSLLLKIPTLYFESKRSVNEIISFKASSEEKLFISQREEIKNQWAGKILKLFNVKYNIEEDICLKNYDNVILISNHRSMIDIPLIQKIKENYEEHTTVFIAKEELLDQPIIGSVLKNMGGIAIKRGSSSGTLKLLREIKTLSKNNKNIFVIFPEGTRTRKDGLDVGKFKQGVGFIIKKFKFPVIPIFIDGKVERFLEERDGDKKPVEIKVGEVTEIEGEEVEKFYLDFLKGLSEKKQLI